MRSPILQSLPQRKMHSLIRRFRATFSRGEKEKHHTFNNRNSRSHELITRKNVSYSLRFTDT
jgi:hypothetical protein